MESVVAGNLRSHEMFIKNSDIFEKDLKARLNWNNKQWSDAGESGSRFNRLCNSLHYWKSKLKPAVESKSVVVTLFNLESNVKVSVFQIVEAIESLDKSFIVKGVADFRNPRYLCLYFENEEIRDRVKEAFRFFNNNYVVYLSWALENLEGVSTIKVHWLPMTVDLNIIKQALEKYVTCIEEERKFLSFMSGRNMPSGRMVFKVKLKKDIKVEQIPHVMEIFGMETLITVPGRKKLCLNCDLLGHVSRDCNKRFCGVCRALKEKVHECSQNDVNSYAGRLKNINKGNVSIEPDDWGDSFDIKDNDLESTEKVLLDKKIKSLEDCLDKAQVEHLDYGQASYSKKIKIDYVEQKCSDQTMAGSSSEDQDVEVLSSDSDSKRNLKEIGAEFITTKDKDGAVVKDLKKNKKKKKHRTQSEILENFSLASGHGQGSEQETQIRSYGKPIRNNARMIKQQDKFDKLVEKREFIFQD